MDKVAISFTMQELNYICAVLEDRPFKEVKPLLSNIEMQFRAITADASDKAEPDNG